MQVATLERDDTYRVIVRRAVVAQLVRAAMSVGANLEEATAAQSKADFVAKVSIARKECREAQYWLRLGRDAGVIHRTDWPDLLGEAEEISRIVAAIARNAKRTSSRSPQQDA